MDDFKLRGRVRLDKVTPGIDNVETQEINNTVVTVGKSQIAGLILSDVNVGSAFDWVSIGLGSSTIVAGDVTLGSEYIKYGLGSITGTRTTTSVTNDTARLIGSFGITDTKTINEAGIFNQSGLNTGSMLGRVTFAGINVISGDFVRLIWDIQVS